MEIPKLFDVLHMDEKQLLELDKQIGLSIPNEYWHETAARLFLHEMDYEAALYYWMDRRMNQIKTAAGRGKTAAAKSSGCNITND